MTNVVPLMNPQAEYSALRPSIDEAVQRVLLGGHYVLGEEVAAFERDLAAYIGVPSVVGVANGTDALALALRACGVERDDEVVTVSHTAVATVAAIESIGAVPILVDVEPKRYTMSPQALQDLLARSPKKPKAVVPVHLYGLSADMTGILDVARAHGLVVVEDCAQAIGASFGRNRVGSFGDAAAFSFYPTKNLGALGDGGAVACSTPEIADRVRLLRQYGWRERYVSAIPGTNSRLDEIQAAVLRVKLHHLDSLNKKRQSIAAMYTESLAATSAEAPARVYGCESVFHLYVIACKNRDTVRRMLMAYGVASGVHYPAAVHQQPAYKGRIRSAPLPVTEAAVPHILSLPMYPQLSNSAIKRVQEALQAVLAIEATADV